ncbi:MAG: tail fiber domain-containing protein [Bacteroidales bacterium]|nr:tail fiber domain-containing protein [Bacteroidales bacterium]
MGSGNVYLGSNAGSRNKGSNNVFIGNNAAEAFPEANNLFVLENGNKDETRSLMVGQFDRDMLRINAFTGVNAKPDSAYALVANGTISVGEVATNSDARFKKNIESLQEALDVITSLEGVTYKWDRDRFPERNFDDQKHLGFIAQEVESVMPELVSTDSRGYKSVNYQKVSTLLVEAMKEQQQQISERDEKISEMDERIRKLEELLVKD